MSSTIEVASEVEEVLFEVQVRVSEVKQTVVSLHTPCKNSKRLICSRPKMSVKVSESYIQLCLLVVIILCLECVSEILQDLILSMTCYDTSYTEHYLMSFHLFLLKRRIGRWSEKLQQQLWGY